MSHLEEGLLHALLDGEIPSSELAPIQAHLAACPECRERLEAERQLLADAEGLVGVLEVPASEAEPARRTPARARRAVWPRRLAWAASVLVATGLGYVAHGVPPAVKQEMASGPGAPRNDNAVPAPPRHEIAAPATPRTDSGLVIAGRQNTMPSQQGKTKGARQSLPPASGGTKSLADSPTQQANAVAEPKESGAGAVAAVPVAPATQSLDETRRLDAFRAPALTGLRAADKMIAPAEPISLPDALRRLGGSLRLIDGLVPLRLEAQGPSVRVVYPAAQGELVLAQELIDGRVVFRLIAPPGFPADSLARLRARVRE